MGVDKAMTLDETLSKSLENGMPQTGGCGLGIDYLTMLFTDSQNIMVQSLFSLSLYQYILAISYNFLFFQWQEVLI